MCSKMKNQGVRGHRAVNSISSQNFIITFSCLMLQQLRGLLFNFNWLKTVVEITAQIIQEGVVLCIVTEDLNAIVLSL